MQTRLYIRDVTKKKLDKLVIEGGTTYVQWLDDAVDFFEKTGKDPATPSQDISKQIASLERLVKTRTDRIIAFIKESEKEYLTPIVNTQNDIFSVLSDRDFSSKSDRDFEDNTEKNHIDTLIKNDVDNSVVTSKDEEIYRLQEELKREKSKIKELTNSISVTRTSLGKVRYELDITEAFYQELKLNNY